MECRIVFLVVGAPVLPGDARRSSKQGSVRPDLGEL